jgi:cobalt-zinc-cadmium efflux system outer membrane protein
MKRAASLLLIAVAVSTARADEPAPQAMDLDAYLALVGRANLNLAAQRTGVKVAEAQIAIAKLFPEPQLTGGVASFDVRRTGAPTALELGVSQTIELGGKRPNRVRAAELALGGARADLDDFVRTLRSSAANAYVDALAARLVLDRKQKTLDNLTTLVAATEQRNRSGDIGETPVTQSRVEKERFRGDVLEAQADIRDADLALGLYAGTSEPIAPQGDLTTIQPRDFDEAQLIATAKARRPDVLSARAAVDTSAAQIELARSNRAIDVTVALGWVHSFAATDPTTPYGMIAPTPAFDSINATLSIPLPFARRAYHGELDAAIAGQSGNELKLKQVELQAESEVKQALARYRASVDRLKLYTGGILTDSEKVLQSTTYSYQRGDAKLFEVLEAQRTVDEVYLAYYQALADHVHALIAVEQAAGIWDLRF